MIKDDVIIDEEHKSDAYSVSINSLMVLHKPSNVMTLSKVLDNNGYYGRYKIIRKLTKVLGEVVVNVEVYVPNSSFTYLWPFKTMYNLTLGRLLKRPALKRISETNLYVFMLSISNPEGACGYPKIDLTTLEELPYQIKRTFGLSTQDLIYIFKVWAQIGILSLDKNNKLIFNLKHDPKIYSDTGNKDFVEVIDNLLRPDLWPD